MTSTVSMSVGDLRQCRRGVCDGVDDGELMALDSSFTHTCGMAQTAELQQWHHHYFLLVIWQGVKQHLTIVGRQ